MTSEHFEASVTPEGRNVLSLARVQRENNGKVIVCSAVNGVGSVASRVVINVNLQADRPPPLIVHGPTNQTLPIKSVAVMPCKATGVPTPIISWFKEGVPVLPSSKKINISESGLLTISDLNKNDDAGLYTCVASSKSGKSTWSAYLKLDLPTNPNIKFFRAPEASTYPGPPGKSFCFWFFMNEN